jgi:hypothetical protein
VAGRGIDPAWLDFNNFREWALANGYCKKLCSLDRRRPEEGYNPRNCRWVTVRFNSLRALYLTPEDPWEMGGRPMAAGPDCPF